jgi:thymidylate synthase (FAD)
MKVHSAPLVILLASPVIRREGVTALMAEYGMPPEAWKRLANDVDGDSLPELAGRVCYGSFGDRQGRTGAEAYLAHILEEKHGSVLEHGSWTFAVCRASRGYTHQQVRHRAGFAYSQESQHFIHYADDGAKGTQEPAICVTGIPEGQAREFAINEAKRSIEGYVRLWDVIRAEHPADAKVKKIVSGSSRGLLPTALESRLIFTANARAIRHEVEMRGNPDNTLEIRLVAAQLARIMSLEAPGIFQDITIIQDTDGWPTVQSKYPKV